MESFQVLLKRNLQGLGLAGANPYRQNLVAYMLKIGAFVLITALLILTSCQVFIEWNGVDTLSRIVYLPPIFLSVAKMIFLMIKMKPLKQLIDGFSNYWPLDKFGPKIQVQTQEIFDKTYTIIKIYLIACTFFSVLLCSLPFILNNQNLVFSIFEPCDVRVFPCFEVLFTWQTVTMFWVMYPALVGFDTLFLNLILHPYVGLELLKHSFKELALAQTGGTGEEVKRNLKEIVNQHNVILDSINETNRLFSRILMVQFWCALVSQIFALYMLTEEGIPPDSTRLATYGAVYLIYIFQLLSYSFGGMLLIEQTTSVANDAYAFDWYSQTQPDLRKSLAFVILRSHRPNKITIGNMADLDLVSFVTIVKNALSVCALLRQLQEEGK